MKVNTPPSTPRSLPSSRTTESTPLQRSQSAPELTSTQSPPSTPRAPSPPPSSFSQATKSSGPTLQPKGPPIKPGEAQTKVTTGFYGKSKSAPSSPTTTTAAASSTSGASKSPAHQQIVDAAKQKIGEQPDKFQLKYNDQELSQLTSLGHELGIPPQDVTNMIYAGSREAKRIDANEMQAQMKEHAQVMKRGYPHLFHDKAQFDNFSKDLISTLNQHKFPSGNVKIQGSSLRTPNAGDIDVAVMANKEQFAGLLTKNYDNKITQNGQPISLKDKSFEEMQSLAHDIMNNPGYNSRARTFANAVNTGIMHSSSSSNKELSKLAKTLSANYKEPVSPKDPTGQKIESISVVLEGGKFDISPSMSVKA
ncbi:hypothetical protein [Cystobacter fuscus]|uniref:hypothetical protein n=1 Tax=Cystobacter fuscus TaxID=43 RepID=UPI002B2BBE20|nr:hypothetical protein F0U63_22635 [Cystobacter fuscus]